MSETINDKSRSKGLPDGLAVFFLGYIKRVLEGEYDKLFETELGKKIKHLDDRVRYGVEAFLNFLTVIFDQKFKDDSAVKRLLKAVVIDAFPELSKRIINGVKTNLNQNPSVTKSEKELMVALLTIEENDLSAILCWLIKTNAEERSEALKFLSHLSNEELKRFATVSPENREHIKQIFCASLDAPEPKSEAEDIESQIENETIKIARQRLIVTTEAIRTLRQRLRKLRREA